MTIGSIIVINEDSIQHIGVLTGQKMDPNFLTVNILYPKPTQHSVVCLYAGNVTITPITLADLGTSHISDFPILYPEYFI